MAGSSNPAFKQLAATLRDLVEPLVVQGGLFLEEVRVVGAERSPVVRIFVDLPDGPGAVPFDRLEEVTRAISQQLDEADPIAQAYQLEVSTAGAERKLSTPRHFRRAVGSLIVGEITSEGEVTKLEGKIIAADEHAVTVRTATGEAKIAYEDVKSAKSMVDLSARAED